MSSTGATADGFDRQFGIGRGGDAPRQLIGNVEALCQAIDPGRVFIGGSCENAWWRDDLASCRSSRHGRMSGRGADAPTPNQVSDIPRIRARSALRYGWFWRARHGAGRLRGESRKAALAPLLGRHPKTSYEGGEVNRSFGCSCPQGFWNAARRQGGWMSIPSRSIPPTRLLLTSCRRPRRTSATPWPASEGPMKPT